MPVWADRKSHSWCAVPQVEMATAVCARWDVVSPEVNAWWDEARPATNMKGCASDGII